jgi:hypothetical protein
MTTKTEYVKHNHMTRDIKARGQCPACDIIHEFAYKRRKESM